MSRVGQGYVRAQIDQFCVSMVSRALGVWRVHPVGSFSPASSGEEGSEPAWLVFQATILCVPYPVGRMSGWAERSAVH